MIQVELILDDGWHGWYEYAGNQTTQTTDKKHQAEEYATDTLYSPAGRGLSYFLHLSVYVKLLGTETSQVYRLSFHLALLFYRSRSWHCNPKTDVQHHRYAEQPLVRETHKKEYEEQYSEYHFI